MTALIICSACQFGFRQCPVCSGGARLVACPDCDGGGLYYDPDAEKVRECQSCQGEGELEPDSCMSCDGGQVPCDLCCGSGLIHQDACRICGDHEVVTCRECRGTGQVICELDALADCDECEGAGLLACPMHH